MDIEHHCEPLIKELKFYLIILEHLGEEEDRLSGGSIKSSLQFTKGPEGLRDFQKAIDRIV